jgi:hypothetical protein
MAEQEAFRRAGSAYRKVVSPQMREVVSERLSSEARRGIKAGVSWLMVPAERVDRVWSQRRLRRRYEPPARSRMLLADGRVAYVHDGLTAALAREVNHAAVTTALSVWRIPHFTVPGLDDRRMVVAVAKENRGRTYHALRALLAESPGSVESVLPASRRDGSEGSGDTPADWRTLGRAKVIRVSWLRTEPTGRLVCGADSGVEIELWSREGERLRGPRQNRVMRVAPAAPATVSEPFHVFSGYVDPDRAGAGVLTHPGFGAPRVDEVAFPVDAVYVWRGPSGRVVDGEDVAQTLLRAALRSVHQHAPWTRTVHVVAAQPVPAWVDSACERLSVVPAERLAGLRGGAGAGAGGGPIEHRLHRIPGLGEQFVYLPAGGLLGRPVRPNSLFTPAGLAQFVAAPDRPGSPRPAWSAVVERETGRRVSTGVFAGPQALRVSVLADIAGWVAEASAAGDVDAQVGLHHYLAAHHAFALERGARFLGVHVDAHRLDLHLDRLGLRRDTEFIQLSGLAEGTGTDAAVRRMVRFLADYFPVPSHFENAASVEHAATVATRC